MTLNNQEKNKGISHYTFVKILKKFSPDEIKEFEKLLNSPLHNNHLTLIKLFGELKKYYPKFSDRKITKEFLFGIVNKGKSYDDKLFRKYLSRLNKLAEEYLHIVQMRKEKEKRDLNVLLQLSKRDLKEVYARKLKDVERSFEKDSKIDPDHFLSKYQLSLIKYNQKSAGNYIDSYNDELTDSYNNLVSYFLFYSESLINQIETNKFSFCSKEELYSSNLLFDKINIKDYIKKINKDKTQENPDRLLFLELIMNDSKMISHDSDLTAYKNLRSLVYINSGKLSDQLLYFYLQRMNIFCILENVKGDNDMNKELFENYKMLIDNNLLDLKGSKAITILDFRQILSSALKNNEFKWAEKFIESKLELVKEELRINIYHYSYALLRFSEKNYEGSLDHLLKIKSESMPVKIDIYVLKAKIFYDQGHFDSALSIADSFRHYISGNKLIAVIHKTTLMNFLKYFKLIIKLNVNFNKTKLKRLLTELQNINYTKEKRWLIEKTGELLLSV